MTEILRPIGGYFELELSYNDSFPRKDGLYVNSGRNALELILSGIPTIENIYIPYYTCDVVLEPIKKLNLKHGFYHIDENLELSESIELKDNEYIIYTNYFGIKDCYIERLSKKYKNNLIIDNAQALYAFPTAKCIYSPRKFVGIPDGGIAYTDNELDIYSYEKDCSYDKCEHLLIRHDKGATEGYSSFKENSAKLKNNDVKQMSSLTKHLISSIDFNDIHKKRLDNFNYLHNYLKESNILKIDDYGKFSCAMVYPYYSSDTTLKQRLIENKIFVATYWPNVFEWCKPEDIEYKLANNIIAIPIDQRYGIEDMERILNEIKL